MLKTILINAYGLNKLISFEQIIVHLKMSTPKLIVFAILQALVVPDCLQVGILLLDRLLHIGLQRVDFNGSTLTEERTAQGRGKEKNKADKKRLNRSIQTGIFL